MDTSALQAGLSQLEHLLPSQREWVERLLFQLAFNEVKRIDVVAADGSGKSTLALALAELFSREHNVALLSARITPEQAAAEVMQQWFALPLREEGSLASQVEAAADTTPLLLLIDDAGRYPAHLLQQLAALPCLLCCFSDQSLAEAGLTLTLNRVTAADAAQLLQHEALNSIELTERLARANGNLHLLLLPPRQRPADEKVSTGTPWRPMLAGLLATAFMLLAYHFWPDSKQAELQVPERTPAVIQPAATTAPVAATDQGAGRITQPESESESDPLGLSLAEQPQSASAVPDTNKANPDSDPSRQNPDAEALAANSKKEDANLLTTPSVTAPDSAKIVQAAADPVPALRDEPLFDEASLLQFKKSATAVQLAVLSSTAALTRFKRTYPDIAVLTYQRSWQGKMQLVLVLAPFDSVVEAKAAMAQLPAALRATGPFVKSVAALQAEIRARQLTLQSATE